MYPAADTTATRTWANVAPELGAPPGCPSLTHVLITQQHNDLANMVQDQPTCGRMHAAVHVIAKPWRK
jgi:hypothetical protein